MSSREEINPRAVIDGIITNPDDFDDAIEKKLRDTREGQPFSSQLEMKDRDYQRKTDEEKE